MFRKLTSRDMPVPARKGTKLNMEHIVQRTAGNLSEDKLYSQDQTVAQGNRVVAVSADMSGSMNGLQVRFALAAIAEATGIVGDEFLATCWREKNRSRSGQATASRSAVDQRERQ